MRLREIMALLFMCCTLLQISAFTLEGLEYEITSDTTVKVGRNGTVSGEVVIPSKVSFEGKEYTVTSIGKYAFSGNSDITSISLSEGLLIIEESAFWKCSSLTYINLPNSITELGESVFNGCSNLQAIDLSNSLTSIGYRAFYECISLWCIDIPNSVTTIEAEAFQRCEGLISVTIPKSVRTIGEMAFYWCKELKDITCYATTPPDIFDNSFLGDFYRADLRIPEESAFEYLSTPWALFYDIRGINTDTSVKNEWEDDTFRYLYFPENHTAILKDLKDTTSPFVTVPSHIFIGKEDSEPYYIKCISINAFKECSLLTSVEFESDSQLESIGDNAFRACNQLYSINLPEGVTHIRRNVFYECRELNEVTLPSTLTSIGTQAFRDCSKLTSITIPNGITHIPDWSFYNCTVLGSVSLPSSLESIGFFAFGECHNLKNLSIPNSVTTIGASAFNGCKSLENIDIPNSVTTINGYTFNNCIGLTSVNISNSVTTIGEYAFNNCDSLISINLPNSITKIEGHCLSGCKTLPTIVIPNSVTSIEEYTFSNCEALSSIVIPNSVTTIENNSFYACISLSSVTLPTSLITIGENAFHSCIELAYLTLPPYLTTIGLNAFYNCLNLKELEISDGSQPLDLENFNPNLNFMTKLYVGRDFYGKTFSYGGFTDLTIGNCVTKIPDGAFYGCGNLKSVTLGSNIVSIGENAFRNSNLKEIVLPSSITSIGNNAFESNSLKKTVIGCGLNSIGEKAFYHNAIESVYITAPEPPTLGQNSFDNRYSLPALYLENSDTYLSYHNSSTWWGTPTTYLMTVASSLDTDVEKLEYAPGTTQQLYATISPENASLKQIFWSSNNPDLATVDNNGLVTYHEDRSDSEDDSLTADDKIAALEITASTLYSNAPKLIFTVGGIYSDIQQVPNISEDQAVGDSNAEVYNLNGIYVSDSTENLEKGIYIVRNGNQTKKVVVK